MTSFCCFLFDVLVVFIWCGVILVMVCNKLLMFQKMGDGFKEFVHYSIQVVASIMWRQEPLHCIIPSLNMTKPGVTRNNLRVMVVCSRSLRTDLQCNLLSHHGTAGTWNSLTMQQVVVVGSIEAVGPERSRQMEAGSKL